ncbi:MAG: hypothetical protein WCA34_05270 [Candidatus Acidiferrales bacterium]
MYQSVIDRSDPQAAIAIPQPRSRKRILRGCGVAICYLELSVHEPDHSATQRNQQCAAIIFCNTLDAGRVPWDRIEFAWARFPSPQSRARSGPQVAVAILIKPEHSVAEGAVLSIAAHCASLNRAEFPGRVVREPTGPHNAFLILYQREDNLVRQLRIQRELTAFPTGQPFPCTDPKRPVARHEQALDFIRWEMLIRRFLPRDSPYTIEAKQAEFSAEPEITVRRLGDGVDAVPGKAVASVPRFVRVLTHVQCRVQSVSRGRTREQNGGK